MLPLAFALVDSASPVLPPRLSRFATDSARRPAIGSAPEERPYLFGPSRIRYLPGSSTGFGGTTTQLALVRSDPVGRLGISLLGSVGAGALPAGGALTLTSRTRRTELTATGWISHEAPSRQFADALVSGLDLSRAGGALRAERTHTGDGWNLTGTLALLGEHQRATTFDPIMRRAGILALTGTARQRDGTTRYQEWLSVTGETGRSDSGSYLRHRGAFAFGTATGSSPLGTIRVAYGNVSGRGSVGERFVIGGVQSPLMDSLYDARRVDLPAYPVGSVTGTNFTAYRAGVPFSVIELFYSGATTDLFRHQLRSFGAEIRQRVPAIAALGTPDVDVTSGIARAVDAPVKGAWRYYMTLAVRP
jgi:hypothetical protein